MYAAYQNICDSELPLCCSLRKVLGIVSIMSARCSSAPSVRSLKTSQIQQKQTLTSESGEKSRTWGAISEPVLLSLHRASRLQDSMDDATANSGPFPRAQQILPVPREQHDLVSLVALQIRQPAIGGGKIPFAGCCRSSICWGKQQMLRRYCSPAFGHCHDEHADLQFPKRNSQMPPVDIGCAAFDSRFLFLLLNRTVL